MGSLVQDLRYGWRSLSRAPSFAVTAIASLTLGIAANVVVFSLLNLVLFRPLPVTRPDELVRIGAAAQGDGFAPLSYPEYEAIRDGATGLGDLVVHRWNTAVVNPGASPREEPVEVVSDNYFTALGIRPTRGRGFQPGEGVFGRPVRVAVVSERYWRRNLQAAPTAVGRELRINGEVFTIVGVAPRSFRGTLPGFAVSLWTTLSTYEEVLPADGPLDDPQSRSLMVLGRRKEGVGRRQLDAQLNVVSRRMEVAAPGLNRGRTYVTASAAGVLPPIADVAAPFVTMLLAVVTLVLVAACANVANLLLGRAEVRKKEIAVRVSIGAGPRRIAWQLFVESLMLAGIAGGAAVAVTAMTLRVLTALLPAVGVSIDLALTVNARLVGYALALGVLTSVAFGAWPAVRAAKPSVMTVLRDVAMPAGRQRVGKLLVTAQVTVSVALLMTSGLFVRSLQETARIDPGFDADDVLLVSGDPGPLYRYPERVRQHWRSLQEEIAAIPGVQQTALSLFVPLGGRSDYASIGGSETGDEMRVHYNLVSPGYLSLLRITVLAGRSFEAADQNGSPVAMVNSTLGRILHGRGLSVLGSRVRVRHGDDDRTVTVVGIVADTKYRRLGEHPIPLLYLPVAHWDRSDLRLYVRIDPGVNGVGRAVAAVAMASAPEVPVSTGRMEDEMGFSTAPLRFAGGVITTAGVVGLLISVMGIFGVVSYVTGRRRHEFGVRRAVGATAWRIRRSVLFGGLRLVGVGAVLGIGVGVGIATSLSALLVGVTGLDPLTMAAVTLLAVLSGLLGSYVPAGRAAAVDPVDLLRLGE